MTKIGSLKKPKMKRAYNGNTCFNILVKRIAEDEEKIPIKDAKLPKI